MNPDRDLVPLVEGADTPDPVRAALSNARAGLPTGGQIARLASRLPLSPGGPGGAGGSGAPPSAPAMSGAPAASGAAPSAPWLFPGAMIGASVVIVIAGAIAAFSPAFQRHTASSPHVPGKDATSMSLPANSASSDCDRLNRKSAVGGAALPADTVAEQAGAPGDSPPRQTPSAAGTSSAGLPASAAPSSPKPVSQPLPSESALLQRAKDALATDPARALTFIEQHRRLYPKGMLAEEREVLAVKALVASGRESEAKKRAGAFVSAYPDSAYRPRVEPSAPRRGE